MKLTKEHKLKLSKAKKGKSYEEIYGIITSKKLKQIRREARLGYKFPNEIKIKISKSEKGKIVSKETRKKLSLNHKGGASIGHPCFISKEKNREQALRLWKNKDFRNKMREIRKKQIFPIKDTSIEVKIQNFLKQLGVNFFTHQWTNKLKGYFLHMKYPYQCDIFIPSMNLVIECDGNYWHKYPIGNDIDKIRTSELIQKGFKILRLWESEIKVMDINKFKKILP